MEPPCGQSIVKCEKQKDDGRMETQKRKQNEKEKAERRMKIVAGLGSVDEYIRFYNEIRPHQTLKYKTPQAFEAAYQGSYIEKPCLYSNVGV